MDCGFSVPKIVKIPPDGRLEKRVVAGLRWGGGSEEMSDSTGVTSN